MQTRNPSMLSKVFILASIFNVSFGFNGDATFYGGAGAGGSCTSDFVPPGFKTIAMNNAQYENGRACGSCVQGCFNMNGKQECFKAIVDNLCPECKFGDLDMGWSGDGRWSLEWEYIECPYRDPIFKTEGSNSWYGKLKIEGVGPVDAVQLNGIAGKPTPDGYWVVNDNSGKLGCGPRVTAQFASGRSVNQCLSGSMFGGACPGGEYCSGGGKAVDNGGESVNDQEPWNVPVNVPKNSNVAGAKCENGIPHPDGVTCCSKSCGACGGNQCSSLPGGADQCCSSQIRVHHTQSCASSPAPCLML